MVRLQSDSYVHMRNLMSTTEAHTLLSATAPDSAIVQRIRPGLGLFECLVVATVDERQLMLAQAAAQGGWRTVVCNDVANAHRCLAQHSLQLAVVDLAGRDYAELGQLLEMIAAKRGLLLMVCGNEGRPQEEIQIRQLGAWLYLPGVVEGSDVSALCEEARLIAEKLREGEPRVITSAVQPPRQRKR